MINCDKLTRLLNQQVNKSINDKLHNYDGMDEEISYFVSIPTSRSSFEQIRQFSLLIELLMCR